MSNRVLANYVPGVKKIAVLRANGIGDYIFSISALDALRHAYPTAEIVLLAKRWHVRFLTGRPSAVDRVIAVPPSTGINDDEGPEDEARLAAFFEEMNREAFDLAIQMHGGGRNSNPFVLGLGARLTAGMKAPEAVPLDRWMPYVYFQCEYLRYLELVSLVGAPPAGVEPHICVTESDRAEAAALVPRGTGSLALLHPGAGDPRRRWPVEKFAAVGDALAAAGAHVLIGGSNPECALADGVAGCMKTGAQSVCGQLSLGGLAGLLERCQVVVSNDSGPLHVAGAVGAPTVGIYWCGNMMTSSMPLRSRHRPCPAWRLQCPICGRNTIHDNCDHHDSFVADVSVEEVTTHALDLFQNQPPPTAM